MMNNQPDKKRPGNRRANGIPAWFRLSLAVVAALIVIKALGWQVVVKVSYDGIPFLASLTDIRIYLVLLGVLLVYILTAGFWKKFFDSGDN